MAPQRLKARLDGAAPGGEQGARFLGDADDFPHKDDIRALQVLYSRPHKDRLTFADVRELARAIERPPRQWTPEKLWNAYQMLDRSKVRGSGGRMLTDIVALVRGRERQKSGRSEWPTSSAGSLSVRPRRGHRARPAGRRAIRRHPRRRHRPAGRAIDILVGPGGDLLVVEGNGSPDARHGDVFFIALPYGPRTDWLRNVIAAGAATLVVRGQEYRVGQPEVMPTADAAQYFPAGARRMQQRFGVDSVLRLQLLA